jgi:hypothetical protein
LTGDAATPGSFRNIVEQYASLRDETSSWAAHQ